MLETSAISNKPAKLYYILNKRRQNVFVFIDPSPAGSVAPQDPFCTLSQVAITLHYRYQPPAGAPIDAGELVSDTGKVDGYR
jgi:hypothetical protein